MSDKSKKAAKKPEPEYIYLVVNHELRGVTPEMILWWGGHIDNSERYRLWHPEDHISFEWEVPPSKSGHFGAIHVAEEKIGRSPPIKIRIRYVDPATSPIRTTYPYVAAGCSLGPNDEPRGWSCHELKPEPWGTRMRSTFRLPANIPKEALEALRRHNIREMGRLPEFLPELYRKETGSDSSKKER